MSSESQNIKSRSVYNPQYKNLYVFTNLEDIRKENQSAFMELLEYTTDAIADRDHRKQKMDHHE